MGPIPAPVVTPETAAAIFEASTHPDSASPVLLPPVLGVSADLSAAPGPDPLPLPDAPAAVGGCGVLAAFLLLLALGDS
jgi:hypothetical protein